MKLFKKRESIDEDEFIELLESKKGAFYRVAFSYTKNKEDALDVISESVCKAFTNLNKLNDPGAFYPWFYRILTNTAISHMRRNSRFAIIEEYEDSISQNDNISDILTVREELNKLDQKYREVIILKFNEELTFKQISEITGKKESTIKTNYYRGIELLRERIKPYEK